MLPDVDAKKIAPQLFWAAFQNNAQFCNSTKRLYVHEDIYDEVLRELVAFARPSRSATARAADTQLGPIQNQPQYDKVLEYFDDCRANGHRFALGGEIDATRGAGSCRLRSSTIRPRIRASCARSRSARSCRCSSGATRPT